MPYIEIGPSAIHYLKDGAGIPIVFLHAIGLDATWWKRYFKHFRAKYRVVAVDLRGQGLSGPAGDSVSLENHAADVAALIEQLGGAAHIVGVSMGGMVAQYLAIGHPEKVRSLALISTFSTLAPEVRERVASRGNKALADGMAAVVGESLERWIAPGDLGSAFAARCAERLLAQDAASWAANWQAISRVETLPRLAGITCPILLCTGSLDVSTTPESMGRMSDALSNAGRAVPLRVVAGAAHLGAFQYPDSFIALLEKHLDHCQEVCHAAE